MRHYKLSYLVAFVARYWRNYVNCFFWQGYQSEYEDEDEVDVDGCYPEWKSYGDYCYRYFYHQAVSWIKAEEMCQTYVAGGHLASVQSQEEMDVIYQMVKTSHCHCDSFVIHFWTVLTPFLNNVCRFSMRALIGDIPTIGIDITARRNIFGSVWFYGAPDKNDLSQTTTMTLIWTFEYTILQGFRWTDGSSVNYTVAAFNIKAIPPDAMNCGAFLMGQLGKLPSENSIIFRLRALEIILYSCCDTRTTVRITDYRFFSGWLSQKCNTDAPFVCKAPKSNVTVTIKNDYEQGEELCKFSTLTRFQKSFLRGFMRRLGLVPIR